MKTMLTENLQTLFIHRGPDLFSFVLFKQADREVLTESRPLGKVEIDCRRQPAGRAERERTHASGRWLGSLPQAARSAT